MAFRAIFLLQSCLSPSLFRSHAFPSADSAKAAARLPTVHRSTLQAPLHTRHLSKEKKQENLLPSVFFSSLLQLSLSLAALFACGSLSAGSNGKPARLLRRGRACRHGALQSSGPHPLFQRTQALRPQLRRLLSPCPSCPPSLPQPSEDDVAFHRMRFKAQRDALQAAETEALEEYNADALPDLERDPLLNALLSGAATEGRAGGHRAGAWRGPAPGVGRRLARAGAWRGPALGADLLLPRLSTGPVPPATPCNRRRKCAHGAERLRRGHGVGRRR